MGYIIQYKHKRVHMVHDRSPLSSLPHRSRPRSVVVLQEPLDTFIQRYIEVGLSIIKEKVKKKNTGIDEPFSKGVNSNLPINWISLALEAGLRN